jgi:hypothetical protein
MGSPQVSAEGLASASPRMPRSKWRWAVAPILGILLAFGFLLVHRMGSAEAPTRGADSARGEGLLGGTVVVQGQLASGIPWQLVVKQSDEELCLEFGLDQMGANECHVIGPDERDLVLSGGHQKGVSQRVLFGSVSDLVSRVETFTKGQQGRQIQLHSGPRSIDFAGKFFITFVSKRSSGHVVAKDSDGNWLASDAFGP